MPVKFGTSISAVTVTPATGKVVVDGAAFGENQYPISDIQYRIDGGAWASVGSLDAWGDSQVEGTLSTPLAAGVYDVRVISSDGETSDPYINAITVSSAGGVAYSRMDLAISLGI